MRVAHLEHANNKVRRNKARGAASAEKNAALKEAWHSQVSLCACDRRGGGAAD